jgi:hypothetical protein
MKRCGISQNLDRGLRGFKRIRFQKSALLSCKFIAACEHFFSGSLRNSFIRGRLPVMGIRPTLSFLTVILCGPLSHLRYQRNPRSKLSVAAEPRWVIRGSIFRRNRERQRRIGFNFPRKTIRHISQK